jgi:hypothetical protein
MIQERSYSENSDLDTGKAFADVSKVVTGKLLPRQVF